MVEEGGVLFFSCYLRVLNDSSVTESGCSGNDGWGKLFWGIKNLSSCCFLVAIKVLAHLSRSDKVSFCDRSLSIIRRPLTIDLNDNSS